ncbi:class I SAM-dependent methyltransferase [Streptomyces sp. NPDC047315]|uniref:class I SAM-dependent methyltransferase n=1 Tax=Streptomyces sp. NPDC047315 TaxID=3155142 RepID=UPI00340E6FE9
MLGETARTWLKRWDEQQERYSPDREERFQVILDVTRWSLERASPERPRIVDLGCGTGSLTVRLARALPDAEVVGVDADPMMLGLGEENVAGTGARLLLDDLNSPDWPDRVAPGEPWDAAVSSTALHWLEAEDLAALYGMLAARIRPGGVFVDANNRMPEGSPESRALARRVRDARAERAGKADREDWDSWWKAFLAAPELAELAREREQRAIAERAFAPPLDLTLDEQADLLKSAGFRTVTTVWQCGDDSVLVALR